MADAFDDDLFNVFNEDTSESRAAPCVADLKKEIDIHKEAEADEELRYCL